MTERQKRLYGEYLVEISERLSKNEEFELSIDANYLNCYNDSTGTHSHQEKTVSGAYAVIDYIDNEIRK